MATFDKKQIEKTFDEMIDNDICVDSIDVKKEEIENLKKSVYIQINKWAFNDLDDLYKDTIGKDYKDDYENIGPTAFYAVMAGYALIMRYNISYEDYIEWCKRQKEEYVYDLLKLIGIDDEYYRTKKEEFEEKQKKYFFEKDVKKLDDKKKLIHFTDNKTETTLFGKYIEFSKDSLKIVKLLSDLESAYQYSISIFQNEFEISCIGYQETYDNIERTLKDAIDAQWIKMKDSLRSLNATDDQVRMIQANYSNETDVSYMKGHLEESYNLLLKKFEEKFTKATIDNAKLRTIHFQGGGLGLKGAAKGIITAEIMNAAVNTIANVSIKGSVNDLKLYFEKTLTKLFAGENAKKRYEEIIKDAAKTLKKNCMDILFSEQYEDWDEAKKLITALDGMEKQLSQDELQAIICKMIFSFPFSIDSYMFALKCKKDAYLELCAIAAHFGMSEKFVQEIEKKEKILYEEKLENLKNTYLFLDKEKIQSKIDALISDGEPISKSWKNQYCQLINVWEIVKSESEIDFAKKIIPMVKVMSNAPRVDPSNHKTVMREFVICTFGNVDQIKMKFIKEGLFSKDKAAECFELPILYFSTYNRIFLITTRAMYLFEIDNIVKLLVGFNLDEIEYVGLQNYETSKKINIDLGEKGSFEILHSEWRKEEIISNYIIPFAFKLIYYVKHNTKLMGKYFISIWNNTSEERRSFDYLLSQYKKIVVLRTILSSFRENGKNGCNLELQWTYQFTKQHHMKGFIDRNHIGLEFILMTSGSFMVTDQAVYIAKEENQIYKLNRYAFADYDEIIAVNGGWYKDDVNYVSYQKKGLLITKSEEHQLVYPGRELPVLACQCIDAVTCVLCAFKEKRPVLLNKYFLYCDSCKKVLDVNIDDIKKCPNCSSKIEKSGWGPFIKSNALLNDSLLKLKVEVPKMSDEMLKKWIKMSIPGIKGGNFESIFTKLEKTLPSEIGEFYINKIDIIPDKTIEKLPVKEKKSHKILNVIKTIFKVIILFVMIIAIIMFWEFFRELSLPIKIIIVILILWFLGS